LSIVNSNNRVKVEIAKRISDWRNGGTIWGSFVDVSEYFIQVVTDYNFSIDDNNLTGKYSQESVNIKFSNVEGTFNRELAQGSLWRSGEYIYHSRLRYYEWEDLDKEEPTSDDIVIDGLIAVYLPDYFLNGDCNLLVNSKLDMLREHFLVTEDNARNNAASSQGILEYIINLYNTYYSELNVNFEGCVFYNSVDFTDLSAYKESLLSLFNNAIDSSGGYGGMINNTFFSSFVGAPSQTGANFTSTNFPVSIWHFKDGTGTSVNDELITNDLTVEATSNKPTWVNGMFDSSARNFLLYSSDGIFSKITTEYSVEMVIKIDNNKLFPTKIPLVFGSSSYEEALHPIIAWSNDSTTTETTIADYATGYKIEGFFLTRNYEVLYGNGTVSGNSFSFTFSEVLGQLDADGMYQYLAFSQTSDGDVTFYKNGRFVNGVKDSIGGGSVALNSTYRKRFCGYGYFNRVNGATKNKYEDTCAIYYSGLKINYRAIDPTVCFNTYLSLFSRSAA
jgi:hypothetical protein